MATAYTMTNLETSQWDARDAKKRDAARRKIRAHAEELAGRAIEAGRVGVCDIYSDDGVFMDRVVAP